MLKASSEEGITMLRHLTAFSEGVNPKDWEESYIIKLCKGNGDALDRDSYWSLKHLKLMARSGHFRTQNGEH